MKAAAVNLINMGFDVETISKAAGIDVREIERIKRSLDEKS